MTTILILLGCAVIAANVTIVFFACLASSSRFEKRLRDSRRTDEDHERARWMWKKTVQRIK